MADINQAIDTLDRFAVQFQGLVDLRDALRDLGSITGQAESARRMVEQATADRDALLAEADAARSSLSAVNSEALSIAANAAVAANEVRVKAEKDASDVVELAKLEAMELVAQARQRLAGEVDDLTARRNALASDIATLTGEAKRLREQIASDIGEADIVRAQLAAVREQVRGMLAG